MNKILCICMFWLGVQFAFGQTSTIQVEMEEASWEIPEDAQFEDFEGRQTLVMKGGRASVKDLDFENGSIEVDVYATKKRSFAGITFRKQKDNMDEVYMRMHKSSQVDAVQYTPIFNNESNWQLYREYQAKVTFADQGWNTLRIEVHFNRADVFVNEEKVLSIDDLRTGHQKGQIGLFALFSSRFSNFRVTHKDLEEEPTFMDYVELDPAVIRSWDISPARRYNEGMVRFTSFEKKKYTTVETEDSGLLPISKYVRKSSSGNFEQNVDEYIVAKTSVEVAEEMTRRFSFDYSDKIIVYLNGKEVFKGNNAFRTKGLQYAGHLNINTNTLYLPLEKGVNTIHCVIIDKANGWGLMGKLD